MRLCLPLRDILSALATAFLATAFLAMVPPRVLCTQTTAERDTGMASTRRDNPGQKQHPNGECVCSATVSNSKKEKERQGPCRLMLHCKQSKREPTPAKKKEFPQHPLRKKISRHRCRKKGAFGLALAERTERPLAKSGDQTYQAFC